MRERTQKHKRRKIDREARRKTLNALQDLRMQTTIYRLAQSDVKATEGEGGATGRSLKEFIVKESLGRMFHSRYSELWVTLQLGTIVVGELESISGYVIQFYSFSNSVLFPHLRR